MAIYVVWHALAMVIRNFGNALKASAIPFGIFVALAFAVPRIFGLPYGGVSEIEPGQNPGAILVVVLFFFAVYLFVSAWVAVTWHRFVLLEEQPKLLPTIAGRPIWPYIQRVLMIFLQILGLFIPLAIVALIMMKMGLRGAPQYLLLFLLNILFGAIFLRVGISLPATALGEYINSRQAWEESKPFAVNILLVSLMLFAVNFALNFVVGKTQVLNLGLSVTFLNVAVQWFSIMFGVSVLTTLYGHIVEERPLGNR